MEKKTFVSVFLVALLAAPLLSAKEKGKYEKWLKEEVDLIITKAEREEFNNLKKEKDKEAFVKLFWAKRDPTPLTEKNEFKDEYHIRLNTVKNAFLYGYKTGIDTDMGKVYLLFGKPKIFHPSTGPSAAGQNYPPEVWIYPTQPWMNIPQETFSFVFTHDGLGYVLERARTDNRAMQAFYAYPEKILLYPDLKDIPKYREIEPFTPESFEGRLIQQIKSTDEDIIQIPFESQPIFTKAENQSSYLTLLLKIHPGEERETFQKKLVIFGRLESGILSYDFRHENILLEEKDYFITQVGLPLYPGDYDLFLGISTPDKEGHSIRKVQVHVPDFWNQELALSSILASPQVREEQAPVKKEEYDVFLIGRYSLLPHFSQEYTKDQSLNLFYYIYNMAVDENRNCSLRIEMELQKGDRKFNLNPQERKREVGSEAVLLEGTQISLSAFPETGEYVLTIKLTDELTNKTASQTLRFYLR
ncbi:MAG: GWxTD domain-containing protein [Candidatus Aminicenantes bacterium]|nr:GWxTD domain-containing protein [Candidatus Aminicenantes bacterium]